MKRIKGSAVLTQDATFVFTPYRTLSDEERHQRWLQVKTSPAGSLKVSRRVISLHISIKNDTPDAGYALYRELVQLLKQINLVPWPTQSSTMRGGKSSVSGGRCSCQDFSQKSPKLRTGKGGGL